LLGRAVSLKKLSTESRLSEETPVAALMQQ